MSRWSQAWRKSTGTAQLLVLMGLVLAALALAGGCDRGDNDWSLYDAELKLIHIPTDTLRLAESGGGQAFAVTIGMVPDDTIFVYPVSQDSQFLVRPESLFFAPVDDNWLNPREFEIEAIEDDVMEGDHLDQVVFTVRSADPDYDGQAFDVQIPVVLSDNDLAGVAVSETLITLVESDLGAVYASYRLRLLSQPIAPVTVALIVTPAEPTLHVDPMSVTFARDNWDQEQEITLWIELDSVDFDYQSLVISHACTSADPNYGPSLQVGSIGLEIFDDTLPPVATLAAVAATELVAEGATAGYEVRVSLNRPSAVPVVVHLATADGTAVSGSDYTALDQDVTFQPGDPLSQNFTIMPLDDSVLEETENFTAVITAVSGCVIGAEDRVTIQIIDDDVVYLTLSAVDAAEDSGALDFEVSIPAPAQQPISFTFSTSDGSALAGEDYEAVNETFSIEPGQTSRLIPVVLNADIIHEPDETLLGSLSNITINAVWSGGPVTASILNDDPQNVVFADIEHHETDGSAVFTLELLRPYPEDVNLVVNTLDGDGLNTPADEVDALHGPDYTGFTGQAWTIPAGATSSTLNVPVINDAHAESLYEYFRLEITGSDHSDFLGLVAMCTLIDDQQPCIEVADVAADEDGGSVIFTLELYSTGGVPTTSAADVILQVDTMDQTASEGADYEAYSGLVTIPHGQPSVQVVVNILDDVHDDDNESFVLLVGNQANSLGGCSAEQPFATIIDNEFPSVNIVSTATRLNEGSVFNFDVSLTTQRQSPTTFDLDILAGTSNGLGVDYTFTQSGPQIIPPFTDQISFTAAFLDDQLEGETDEVITVSVTNANCALGVVALDATIVDAPELSISGDSVLEGETAYFTVTADAVSTADMSFSVQHSSGTAITGVDFYDGNTGPYTISAGATTVQVPVPTFAGDGGDNAVEDFYVTIVNPDNATNSPFNSATGTITDGDPPELTWAGSASAIEGNDIMFRMNLSWVSTANVQFSVTFTDGTAARLGIDYDDAMTGPFTILPGNMFYDVAVPTVVDGLPELSAEDFTITMHTPVNATLGSPTFATGLVLDADQPELSFQLDQSATEGGTLTFTVQLNTATTVPVFFAVEFDNGSTQGAGDFDATNTGPFTIAAGSTTATVTVNTIDDAVLEGVESFIIRVVSPVNAILGAGFEASGTIIDND